MLHALYVSCLANPGQYPFIKADKGNGRWHNVREGCTFAVKVPQMVDECKLILLIPSRNTQFFLTLFHLVTQKLPEYKFRPIKIVNINLFMLIAAYVWSKLASKK